MKFAICSSLQGQPEEFSPSTPVDCYRLSGYVYNRIADMYPQAEFDLFNRDDFPGQGDNFIGVRNAIVSWGADFAVHIHQDAGGGAGARGWHVIYYHGEALSLANELVYAMRSLPSPERYGGIVCRSNVAVLKAPKVSVLVEAGFYTSAEDEAIGIDGWGDAIIHGISNYLQHHWGLAPEEEKEDEMVSKALTLQQEKQDDMNVWVTSDAWLAMDGKPCRCYLNMHNESDDVATVYVYTDNPGSGEHKFTVQPWKRYSVDTLGLFSSRPNYFSLIVKSTAPVNPEVTILKG